MKNGCRRLFSPLNGTEDQIYVSCLNGLEDFVGELRRYVLDLIRKESIEKN
jgi:predicted translin family RNA/ssDNA-binding protein